MPTVPKYGPLQSTGVAQTASRRELSPSSFSRVPAGAEAAFGAVNPANPAAFGNAISNLGKSAQNLSLRISTAQAEDALVSFERDSHSVFFDPDGGYFNSEGRDAYDRADQTKRQLHELRREYAKNLKSPAAQRMFSKAADAQLTRAYSEVDRHASTQFKAWEKANINAQIENSLENAALYWADKEKLGVQIELGRQSVVDASLLAGDSAEVKNEKLQTFDSTFARSVITSATQTSSVAGQAALEEYGDLLEGPDKVQVQTEIERKQQVEKTRDDANMATTMGKSLVDAYVDQPAARLSILNEVNQIEDLELRRRVETEAMSQLNAAFTARSEMRSDIYESAEKFILEGNTLEQFIATNPGAWSQLTPSQQSNLSKGTTPTTNFALYSQLMMLPPSQLRQINPADYVDHLAPADRQRLLDAVTKAKSGDTTSQVGRSRTTQTSQTVERLFGDASGWTEKAMNQVNAFYAMLTNEVDYRESKKGSELSHDEFTAVLDDMTKQVVVKKSLGGFDMLWKDDKENISSIPPEDMPLIQDYLHFNNIPATAQNMIRIRDSAEVGAMRQGITSEDVQGAVDRLVEGGKEVTTENIVELYRRATEQAAVIQ